MLHVEKLGSRIMKMRGIQSSSQNGKSKMKYRAVSSLECSFETIKSMICVWYVRNQIQGASIICWCENFPDLVAEVVRQRCAEKLDVLINVPAQDENCVNCTSIGGGRRRREGRGCINSEKI